MSAITAGNAATKTNKDESAIVYRVATSGQPQITAPMQADCYRHILYQTCCIWSHNRTV